MTKFIENNCLSRINQAISSGGWQSVYRQCGVSELCWTKQNQVCPICGGRDRFSIFKKNGFAYCRHCGSRSTLKFVQDYRNCSFVEAVEFAASAIGMVVDYEEPRNPSVHECENTQKTPSAEELWETGVPLDEDCSSARYLLSRGIPGPYPQSLRHCKELSYFEFSEEDRSWSTQYFEGLLCQISKPGVETANLLRIYLDGDRKADIKTPKKVLKGGLAGGYIKLGSLTPETKILGIAEGVETAMSASILFGMPVWSVVNATNLHNFTPPSGIQELWIFADSDSNEAGQRAAVNASIELSKKYPDLYISIRFPAGVDTDWNDILTLLNRSDGNGDAAKSLDMPSTGYPNFSACPSLKEKHLADLECARDSP